MKTRILYVLWAVSCAVTLWLCFRPWPEQRWETNPIYDGSVPASNQITDALTIAGRENKRVLLQFGANWCVWCHRLHRFLETDSAAKKRLQTDYVVVLVDVNDGNNAATVTQYGEPTRLGLPVFVILDANGKQLVTQETGGFVENGSYNSQKVLNFLGKWSSRNDR